MRPQRQAQLLQRNIEQRLGGVRQHPDATEILMLSGMTIGEKNHQAIDKARERRSGNSADVE
jgi:hypothetical protein